MEVGEGRRCRPRRQQLTVSREGLSETDEGHGHGEIAGPVGEGGHRVARATGPQRVDLRVDGPRHGAHACTHKGLSSRMCASTQSQG